jgi:hypothetical protein
MIIVLIIHSIRVDDVAMCSDAFIIFLIDIINFIFVLKDVLFIQDVVYHSGIPWNVAGEENMGKCVQIIICGFGHRHIR